jgi:hypothetical protein
MGRTEFLTWPHFLKKANLSEECQHNYQALFENLAPFSVTRSQARKRYDFMEII